MKRVLSLSTMIFTLGTLSVIGATSVGAESVPKNQEKSNADFTIVARDETKPEDPDTPKSGELILKAVPSFNFGNIEATSIYSGFNQVAKTSGKLQVDDARLGNADWVLTANMGKFTSQDKNLSGAKINIEEVSGSLGGKLSGTVIDDNAPVSITNSIGKRGRDTYSIPEESVKLSMDANPSAQLAKGDIYTTTITWNLSTDQPSADSFK